MKPAHKDSPHSCAKLLALLHCWRPLNPVKLKRRTWRRTRGGLQLLALRHWQWPPFFLQVEQCRPPLGAVLLLNLWNNYCISDHISYRPSLL